MLSGSLVGWNHAVAAPGEYDSSSRSSGIVEKIASVGDEVTETPWSMLATYGPNLEPGQLSVDFYLPEQARAGSLKLAFTKLTGALPPSAPPLEEAAVVLNLDSSLGTVGLHSVKLDPLDPLASAQVVGGAPLSEARYAVALWYQDAAGNSAVASTPWTYLLDRTPPEIHCPSGITEEAERAFGTIVPYTVSATDNVDPDPVVTIDPLGGCWFAVGTHTVTVKAKDDAGNQSTRTFTVTVTDTTPPVFVSKPAEFVLRAHPATGLAVMPNLLGQITASDNVALADASTFTQDPAAGAMVPLSAGSYVTFRVYDQAGNSETAKTFYTVVDHPVIEGQDFAEFVVLSNSPLAAIEGWEDGAVFTAFGVPAIDELGNMAALATVKVGRTLTSAVYFRQVNGDQGDGTKTILAFQGQWISELQGARFKSFGDPLLAGEGQIAFTAMLQGAGVVTATSDESLWTNALDGILKMVLREGMEIRPKLRLKSISSYTLREGELLVLATLAPAPGYVTTADDTVVLRVTASGPQIVLRENDSVLTANNLNLSKVKTISILGPALGSAGTERWHAGGEAVAKVTTSDGRTAVFHLAGGAKARLLETNGETTDLGFAATWSKFGLPAMGGEGSGFAIHGTLKLSKGQVTSANDTVLLYSGDGDEFEPLAWENAPIATGDAPVFASFLDPVVHASGEAAFQATLRGSGVKATDKIGLFRGTPGSLEMVVRLGDEITDADGMPVAGRRWKSFLSYALPTVDAAEETPGLLFLGKMSGPGVSSANDLGVWAQDKEGTVRRLIATGEELAVSDDPAAPKRKIKSLELLTSPKGVFSATRSYNAAGQVAVLVTFTDKSQALVRLSIPNE